MYLELPKHRVKYNKNKMWFDKLDYYICSHKEKEKNLCK